jgi:hypothetical protein
MMFLLVLISVARCETVMRAARNHPALRAIIQTLSGKAPAALGRQKKGTG